MSNIQPPRVQLNFEPDYLPENLPEGADDISDTSNIEDEVLPDEVVMPSVVEREKINSSDIFDMAEIQNELDDMPDNLAVVPDELKEVIKEPPKMYKSPKKPRKVNKNGKERKPMSEDHKKKLAEARKKAVEVRKAKAIERKQQQALEKEEKELLKKQKVKRVQKLKEEVEEPAPAPAPAVSEANQRSAPVHKDSETWITKKDLENAQYEAIAKYETIRKQRKAEKRQAQMIEQERQTLIRKLQPQTYKYRDGSNIYDSCY